VVPGSPVHPFDEESIGIFEGTWIPSISFPCTATSARQHPYEVMAMKWNHSLAANWVATHRRLAAKRGDGVDRIQYGNEDDGMGDYLTDNELSELTGRRQPKRQAAWLTRNCWRFAITDLGRPRVARAYWAKRLADDTSAVPVHPKPDFAALGDPA